MANDVKCTKKTGVSKKLATLGAALLAGLFTVTVQAFPALNLVPGTPDIESAFIDVNYTGNNAGGTLTASGFAQVLTPPTAPLQLMHQ